MRPPLTEQDCIERADHGLLVSSIHDELVGISVEQGTCYGMNKVATQIWDMLSKPRTVADLCLEVEGRFDVSAEACRRDVLAFLERLRAQDLLKVSAPAR